VATTVLAQWVRPPVTTRSFSQTAKRLAKVLDPLSVILTTPAMEMLRRFVASFTAEIAKMLERLARAGMLTWSF